MVRLNGFTSPSPVMMLAGTEGSAGRNLFVPASHRRRALIGRGIELMLIIVRPGKPDLVACRGLAEAFRPHRHRLALDLAKHDTVGSKMLDALHPRRMTVLRHQPDVLGANADQPVAARDQVHRRRADETRGEGSGGPAVQLFRRAVLLDASVA